MARPCVAGGADSLGAGVALSLLSLSGFDRSPVPCCCLWVLAVWYLYAPGDSLLVRVECWSYLLRVDVCGDAVRHRSGKRW